jgi:hypothetical protein
MIRPLGRRSPWLFLIISFSFFQLQAQQADQPQAKNDAPPPKLSAPAAKAQTTTLTERPSPRRVERFKFNFACRLIERSDQKTLWHNEVEKLITAGTAQTIRLNGINSVIRINFTPYRNPDNSITLQAVSQVWMQTEDGRLSYCVFVNSIPITMSEETVFYPLGSGDSGGDLSVLEISVLLESCEED